MYCSVHIHIVHIMMLRCVGCWISISFSHKTQKLLHFYLMLQICNVSQFTANSIIWFLENFDLHRTWLTFAILSFVSQSSRLLLLVFLLFSSQSYLIGHQFPLLPHHAAFRAQAMLCDGAVLFMSFQTVQYPMLTTNIAQWNTFCKAKLSIEALYFLTTIMGGLKRALMYTTYVFVAALFFGIA